MNKKQPICIKHHIDFLDWRYLLPTFKLHIEDLIDDNIPFEVSKSMNTKFQYLIVTQL